MSETLPAKAPTEILDYLIDASGLLVDGETLVEAGSGVAASGATVDETTFTESDITVWLSGGTAGSPIFLTATLKTSGGRTFTRLYTIPFGEPVSLDQAKAQCRVLDDSEDNLIASYIRAAREWVENNTGHILVRRTLTQSFSRFGSYLEINYRPLVSVTSVDYPNSDGVGQTILPADLVVASRHPARIYPALNGWWPTLQRNGELTASFVAGYAAGEEPPALIQAILMLVSNWFDNRNAVTAENMMEVPLAVESLCGQFRSPGV